MKNIYIAIMLTVFTIQGFSQKKVFLRVFNTHSKIAKGHLVGTTDSSIIISKGHNTLEIKYTGIDHIKINHSTGHSMLVTGSIVCAVSAALLLAANGSTVASFQTGYGVASFKMHVETVPLAGASILSGVGMGVVVGGLAGAIKNKHPLYIRGNNSEWQKVKKELDSMLAIKSN